MRPPPRPWASSARRRPRPRPCCALLADKDVAVRREASRALGGIGVAASAAAGALRDAADKDADGVVRLNAAVALWEVGGDGTVKEAVGLLRKSLADKAEQDPAVRRRRRRPGAHGLVVAPGDAGTHRRLEG